MYELIEWWAARQWVRERMIFSAPRATSGTRIRYVLRAAWRINDGDIPRSLHCRQLRRFGLITG